jgi:hypothetical protein
MKFSSIVCVLIGTNTWFSRWVRYEIALAIINERGLLAVDLNSINHNHRRTPDPLGVNPLNFMGVRKDESGAWRLVERVPIEVDDGNVAFTWQCMRTTSRLSHARNSYRRPMRGSLSRCRPTHKGTTSCQMWARKTSGRGLTWRQVRWAAEALRRISRR